jgi:hypothetical protein
VLPDRGVSVFLASGENFPDAVALGPLSFATKVPMLLATSGSIPAVTDSYLRDHHVQHVVIAGGLSALSPDIERHLDDLGIQHERVAGADRATTASALAWWARDVLGWDATHVNLTRGDAFADAVAGGPHAGSEKAPILLTGAPSELSPAAHDYLAANVKTISSIDIFGDEQAVSAQSAAAAARASSDDPSCAGPAPQLQSSADADPRVCVTMALSGHAMRTLTGRLSATLTAENRSADTIDISHPSGCAVWYGLFDTGGQLVAPGPSICTKGRVPDALKPHETRTWTVELHSCYGGDCFEAASVTGPYLAAAGVNTGPSSGVNADQVWFAATQPIFVSS